MIRLLFLSFSFLLSSLVYADEYPVNKIDNNSNENHSDNNNEEFRWGLGIGQFYTGVGANIVLSTPNSAKLVSAGCTDISIGGDLENTTRCGVGLGYVTTKIIKNNGKHGIGGYFHLLRTKYAYSNNSKIEYSSGVSYNYYASGINARGWNFGLGVDVINSSKSDDNLFLSVGYQF